MTHAFFKALLFLGAGSVIHGMHEEQNIQKYGGLKKYMPVTFLTFIIASFAISGFPGLSGFFSKDEILWYSYSNGNLLFWIVGALTAVLTAFYMFRLVSLTFFGNERFNKEEIHPHESPKVMTVPLIILAVLSVIGGYVGVPEVFSGEHGNLFHSWLLPVFAAAERKMDLYGMHTHFEELLLMGLSVAAAMTALYLSYKIYTQRIDIANKAAEKFKGLYNLLFNKYFVDEAYEASLIGPIQKISEKFLWLFCDNKIIDGFVNGTAQVIDSVSGVIRKMQTGIAQVYVLIMMLGITAVLFWIIISL
jgi:NADH-quinone oxidoreductase subunit L